MDLLDFDLIHDEGEGMDLHLKDPRTGAPLNAADGSPVTITIFGSNSEAYRDAQRAAMKQFAGWPVAMMEHPLAQERRDEAELDILVAIVGGWQNIVFDGIPLTFTDTAARAVLTRFTWIRKQVTEAIRDPATFPATRSDWKMPRVPKKTPPQPDFKAW